jgi:hypothetical protein
MKFPSKEQVAQVRLTYPRGVKVACVSIEDPYTQIPPGTTGEVIDVDDTGSVFVKWSNDVTLGAVYGVDVIRRTDKEDAL